MSGQARFVLDTSVFIDAKNLYYAFDICPGFWTSLSLHHEANNICSIDKVGQEINEGRKEEDLVVWARELPKGFFRSTYNLFVSPHYKRIIESITSSSQYTDGAKATFASAADSWLVAYALAIGGTVVTNESPAPNSQSTIKIPDICDQHGVPRCNTFQMLRKLEVRFDWSEEEASVLAE